jgi:uncharacterized ubiquitin-like protein YukD
MKILVNVFVPSISKEYDILVPGNIRIRMVVGLIANCIEDLTDRNYVSSGEECLCSIEKDIILRDNATLNSYGIQNGHRLMII